MSKIAIVTGANKGIGFEIARGLSQQPGFRTILACRNQALGEAAVNELTPGLATDSQLECRVLDISDTASIDEFVRGVATDFSSGIDILINNAAIAFKSADPTPFQQQAAPTIHVNYVGTVELTRRMIPLLQKRAPGARLVNVASMAGHLRIFPEGSASREKIASASETLSEEELDDLMRGFVSAVESGEHKGVYPNTCYGTSKAAVIAYTKIIGRKYSELVINSCCPGWCATDMSSHSGPRSAAKGAETPLYLALDPAITTSGGFYQDLTPLKW